MEKGIVKTYQKIEKGVVDGYQKIEKGVVEGFKKVDNGKVEKMVDTVTGAYKKIEDTLVSGFNKMADGFVEKHLMKEDETLEEAKERIAKERVEKTSPCVNVEISTYNHKKAMKVQKEMIEKNIDTSRNAGKR